MAAKLRDWQDLVDGDLRIPQADKELAVLVEVEQEKTEREVDEAKEI